MIWKIWAKIFSILLLLVAPLLVAQYYLQRESIELVFELAGKGQSSQLLDAHMQLLKRISKMDPAHEAEYRKEFEKTSETRMASQDLQLLREKLIQDILYQTLRNALVILLFSLGFSFLIARSIVGYFQKLLVQNRIQSARLERLGSLESWQKVAKMMVHELRAPITPMKLVATDIEAKHSLLDSNAFQRYLKQGAELIRTQVEVIERFTDSLTQFTKLPEVRKAPGSVSQFLEKFSASYSHYRSGLKLETRCESPEECEISFDPALLNQLLFNLLKNACEANLGQDLHVTLTAIQSLDKTWISISNTGRAIPKEVSSRIFDLYISTKQGSDTSNLGVGLTISKKIALDHGGDLSLLKNDEKEGVTFQLELPNS